MARKVLEITPEGARAASLEENRNTLNERQRVAFGEDLAMSPQTPQAQWSGIEAVALAEVGEEGARAALFGSSVDHAKGTFLDSHGSLLDIRRPVATRSRVTATLTGVAGAGVPEGSRAKADPGGGEFRTLADVVLSPGGVTVEMEASATGPVAAPAGTLTYIVTVIAGWETITNGADAALGIAREGDEPYRVGLFDRTAHSSIGPLSALKSALVEALTTKREVVDNRGSTPLVIQEWTLAPHSILALAISGSDGDVLRSVENHRGMGVDTMTSIRGGPPVATALAAISAGTVTWNGIAYTPLDISSLSTGAARAAALTTLLNPTVSPSGVTVSFIAGRYVAIYGWHPVSKPKFAQATDEEAFGLDPTAGTYPVGPFVRPREVALAIEFTLDRRVGFPSDGLDQVRNAVLARVEDYAIGMEVWANDLLCEAERVAGTRVTGLTVKAGGADVSGVAVPLDQYWSLSLGDLVITVT